MSADTTTQLFRGRRRLSAAAAALSTWDVCAGFKAALQNIDAGYLAQVCRTSKRTAENWKQGLAAPQARHMLSMLQERQLAPVVLGLAGRADLADAEVALAHLESLKSVLGGLRGRERT